MIRRLAFTAIAFLGLWIVACRQERVGSPTAIPSAAPVTSIPETISGEEELIPTLPRVIPDVATLPTLAKIEIVGASHEPVGIQMPAYLAAEISGRRLTQVVEIAGRYENDGRRRIVTYNHLTADGDDPEHARWADGVHEVLKVWYAEGDYLSDGTNGDFVVLWPSEVESEFLTVNGRHRPAGDAEYEAALLAINRETGQAQAVIRVSDGTVITTSPGDEFQITNLILVDDQSLAPEEGMALFMDKVTDLSVERQPLPGGAYYYGLKTENESGDIRMAMVDYTVGNEILLSGYRAYFDPTGGFQFLYPADWSRPSSIGGRLTSANISDTVRLTISTHPKLAQRPVEELKAEVLRSFGNVQVLYEDTVQIGSSGALWTAYGYDDPESPRTGIFLTMIQDGQAYVIDVDGRMDEEATVLEVIGMLQKTWVSRLVSLGQQPGQWERVNLEGADIAVPTTYQYAELNNGWHRFDGGDGGTFLAFKLEPAAGGRILDRIRHWLEVAGRDVTDFAFSEFYVLELGGRSWLRLDFSYQKDEGIDMKGSLMATRLDQELFFSWAEAPADQFEDLDQDTLLLSLADLRAGSE